MNLRDYLHSCYISEDLISVIMSILNAGKKISEKIKNVDIGGAGTENIYGEEQMALDVVSDNIFQEELKSNGKVGLIASEELHDEIKIGDGKYAVCYDPLDGSSLIDTNLSVGSIFSIYESSSFIGVAGKDQLVAGFIVYGPRLTLIISVSHGTIECSYKNNEWLVTKHNLIVSEGKMFAPGNLRIISERDDYLKLMEFWMKNGYTLRYSGGMVPDINQIFLKGKGIFVYPGCPSKPEGKLRLLFECAPMAFLMEQAKGLATDGNLRILAKVIQSIDQKSPIYVGSIEEVERVQTYLS